MRDFRATVAVLCAMLMVSPAAMAQTAQPPAPGQTAPAPEGTTNGRGRFGIFNTETPLVRNFVAPEFANVRLNNSSRLDALVRAGRLYLSLQDAIALSLENNLDVELSRYGPQLAEIDYTRARAGGFLRGVPQSVTQGANSAASAAAGGGSASGGAGRGTGSGAGGGGNDAGGAIITQTGVAPLNYDPVLFTTWSWGHRTQPFANTVTTGTTALVSESQFFATGFQQQFSTGSTVTLGLNSNIGINTNNRFNNINPLNQGNLNLQFSQRLLQGFGPAVNNRNIKIASNSLRIADNVFKQQVIATVSSIINLYWDLVSFNEDLRVRRQALAVAQKFYEDQKKQVEIGTIAPIEIVRAEARVAQAQQDLTTSETSVLQQETIIKNAISRTGVADPLLAEVRIVPVDQLRIPETEPVEPVQDLIARAVENRPEIEQTRINIENTKIGIKGSKSALLPSLDFQASFQNNGQSGTPNAAFAGGGPPVIDSRFLGGWGTALGQMFRRNFPDYSFGFQLNIPIRNRIAQADYARDMLQLRQSELRQQNQLNDIRVSVRNSLISLQQARARYQAAVKERILQEQTLDAEQKKYALGASTAFTVIQTQRDLATAQGAEVAAMAAYNRARNQLDFATGTVLSKYNVEIDEARRGQVSRGPTPIPVVNGR
ncbi:MAG: TolC family protein [Bryobacteraceae bacterium]|nr:TolC family protein [Bryobacteraceae bacterium]